jgi:hypothetical protein
VVSDPKCIVNKSFKLYFSQGGYVVIGAVIKTDSFEDKVLSIDIYGPYEANNVALVTGVWSNKLVMQLGDNLPVEVHSGYPTIIKYSGIELKILYSSI